MFVPFILLKKKTEKSYRIMKNQITPSSMKIFNYCNCMVEGEKGQGDNFKILI